MKLPGKRSSKQAAIKTPPEKHDAKLMVCLPWLLPRDGFPYPLTNIENV